MRFLFILNDGPYGSERTYNGLRLATSLAMAEGNSVSVFFIGDAVGCALAGQTTPHGYYSIERMLKPLVAKGAKLGVCGSCVDIRGIKVEAMSPGSRRSSMEELSALTQEADKVIVF